ncbi:hypothetical protein OPV22_029293 [Ensete ventricosum]|uniref:2-oxoglutarate dehydrogenase, mitochondrial n=1 Tax=Ensete ventricosum TaxID=4639 RepID=A0AAV8P5Z4_ENSVE|nr:hypothetical protein OPV22_029293 [Ensete ventricosum]
MAWLRAVSGVARSAIRRNLVQASHHNVRLRALPPPPARSFQTPALRRKAESAAPIPRPVPLSRLSDSFLDGTSSVYLEELQRAWEADPNNVDASWDNFFRNFVGQAATSPGISGQNIQESMKLLLLVRAYQVNGHMKAKLDPLGLEEREIPEDLDLGLYGLTDADLDREFFLGVWRMAGFLSENRPVQTLREILNRLEQAYCGNVGYEYMHILIGTATKWTAAKRFGLEGGETLIPWMKEMFDRAADLGVESIVIGMPHRGRPTRDGKRIHLSLVANPSHLEAVDPVVIGKTRAKQYHSNDTERMKNMGVLIHGDGSFTGQGVVYETLVVIRNHPSALEIYQNELLESGGISKEEIDRIRSKVTSILNEEFINSKDYVTKRRDWLSAYWTGFKSPEQISRIRNTGVRPEILKRVGQAITSLPEDFKPHRAVKKIFEQRGQMIETGEGIDWAMGEALVFATLLIIEGNHVRLSGQDVERGTFSHRHSVIHDQQMGEMYCSLDHVLMNQDEEMFTVSNSSLSEFAVLGFELGYSMENPNSLVLWEARFGDFSNGAQVMFDQFLSSGESKWLRQTGLVVLLPHGYDGQGLEHSSALLESSIFPLAAIFYGLRWNVIGKLSIVTTPANYFHVLRRQIHREFRKPLIVMSPKNLLRHKDCKSNLSEFDDLEGHPGFDKQGTCFKRLIKDQNNHKEVEEGINRLIFCSGKVYYELHEERKKSDRKDVAICRVEQLCPFPYDLIQRELKRYPNAEIVWCQEEPMNMGAYSYINPRLYTAMRTLVHKHMHTVKAMRASHVRSIDRPKLVRSRGGR